MKNKKVLDVDESIEVCLPEDVLKVLNLKEGDQITFKRHVDGVIIFRSG